MHVILIFLIIIYETLNCVKWRELAPGWYHLRKRNMKEYFISHILVNMASNLENLYKICKLISVVLLKWNDNTLYNKVNS